MARLPGFRSRDNAGAVTGAVRGQEPEPGAAEAGALVASGANTGDAGKNSGLSAGIQRPAVV